MKKIISIIVSIAMLVAIIPVAIQLNNVNDDAQATSYFTTPSTRDSRNEEGKYLVLNNDGSYGGSYNEALYGKGAPLNGEFDVENSDYYFNGDYYNMKSSTQRKIFPKFSPYQQTMQDTSGIACIMMVLNYLGYDLDTYNELMLVNAYESLNNHTIYGNGTSPEGLVKLVNSLGLDGVSANCTEIDTSTFVTTDNNAYADIIDLFEKCITEGKFLVMRYQSANGYGYKTLIGYDSKGVLYYSYSPSTSNSITGDDYFVFAEPNDNYDHFQDGYTANRSNTVIRWWFNMLADGTITDKHSYFIIDPSIDVEFPNETVDKSKHLQTAYDIHLPLNGEEMWKGKGKNGADLLAKKYGSTRNGSKYGYISTGGGVTNRPDLPYTKIADYYTMRSKGSRILLPDYTILQQTMSSSCGVCSVNSALKYYGYYSDTSYYNLELIYTNAYDYNPKFNDIVRNGTSNQNHQITLSDLGYNSQYYQSAKGEEPVFADYDSFIAFVKENLTNDSPIVTIISPSGGHFVTIIGYDSMGTEHIYDDVLIIADSSDYWDGYQDGYNMYSATQYYRQFANGGTSYLYQCLVIYKNN